MRKERPLYMNLMTDFGFKRAFGNAECLMGFLNALLEKDQIVIKSLKYIDKERTPKSKEERLIFYDLLCELGDGTTVIIEMQRRSQRYFKDRTFFYLSRSIVDQGTNQKHWDYHCDKVFAIYITNFHIPTDVVEDGGEGGKNSMNHKPVSEIVAKDADTNEVYSDKYRMFIIDLKAFGIKDEDEVNGLLDGWIYSIKNMGNFKTKPKMAEKEAFKKLFELSEVASMTATEYRNYNRSLKRYWDACAVEDTDNWRFERGKAVGIIEGEAKGLKKGEAKGVAETAIKLALNMYNKGFDKETVTDVLELSEEQTVAFYEAINK
ncbi:MAG: Rpn family recombination-promoting nuclease/putative transposase [Bacteroidales bacterium]|nr:Rpn family recombination-promoting nuclease/putative transposase [Bacteroidales bacterium]